MGVTRVVDDSNQGPKLGATRAFYAMLVLLKKYRSWTDDQVGVSALFRRIGMPTDQPEQEVVAPTSPPKEWITAIHHAINEPQVRRRRRMMPRVTTTDESFRSTVTARQAFDAMIRYLELLEADAHAARFFVDLFSYDEISPNGELNTADPHTWWDWLEAVDVARDE